MTTRHHDSRRASPRRQALRTGAGLLGLGLLAACAARPPWPAPPSCRTATPLFRGPAFQGDLNEHGLADGAQPRSHSASSRWRIRSSRRRPGSRSWTTSRRRPASRSRWPSPPATRRWSRRSAASSVHVGYYGALSFLLAEQQFGAVPIMVDSTRRHRRPAATLAADGRQGLAGQDRPGHPGPGLHLRRPGLDLRQPLPARDAASKRGSTRTRTSRPATPATTRTRSWRSPRARCPCGASNNLCVDTAITNGVIGREEIVILKESAPIPNGPFAVPPDLDPRAVEVLKSAMASFTDRRRDLKKMGCSARWSRSAPSSTTSSAARRRSINLQFDEKGGVKF